MNRGTARPPRPGRRLPRRRGGVPSQLPYTRRNWHLFWTGLGVILFGYILLSIPPVNGISSMTLAPLLLVVGYCVILPIALLIGRKKDKEVDDV